MGFILSRVRGVWDVEVRDGRHHNLGFEDVARPVVKTSRV